MTSKICPDCYVKIMTELGIEEAEYFTELCETFLHTEKAVKVTWSSILESLEAKNYVITHEYDSSICVLVCPLGVCGRDEGVKVCFDTFSHK